MQRIAWCAGMNCDINSGAVWLTSAQSGCACGTSLSLICSADVRLCLQACRNADFENNFSET